MLLLLLGCPPEPPGDDPQGSPCGEGEVQEGARCLPEGCGVGVWGVLPEEDGVLYVDPLAPEGGDGSREHPFRTLLPHANEGGTFYLAEGRYHEPLLDDYVDLTVRGRCKELVTLTAEPGESVVTMRSMPANDWLLKDLTLSGGQPAVQVLAGNLVLEDVIVERSYDLGVRSQEKVVLRRVLVRDILPGAELEGIGLWADAIGVIQGEDVVVEDVVGVGVVASLGTIELERLTVRRVETGLSPYPPAGVVLDWDSAFSCRECVFEDLPNLAVEVVAGSWLELEHSTIRRVSALPGRTASGVTAELGGAGLLRGVVVEEVEGYAVRVDGQDSSLAVDGLEIRQVRPPASGPAMGLLVAGGELRGSGLWVHDVEGAGLVCDGAALELEEVRLGAVSGAMELPDHEVLVGPGLLAAGGCTGSVSGLEVEDTTVYGVVVQDPETGVTLEGVRVEGTLGVEPARPVDVVVQNEGWLELVDAALAGPEHGLIAWADGGARVQGLSLPPSDGVGLIAQQGGHVEGSDLLVQGRVGWGIGAALGASLDLVDVELVDTRRDANRGLGTALAVDGSTVSVSQLDVKGTHGIGVACEAYGVLTLEDAEVVDSQLAGVFVGPDGYADLHGVVVREVESEDTVGLGVGVAVVRGELDFRSGTSEQASHAAGWVNEGVARFHDSDLVGGTRTLVLGQAMHGDALVVVDGRVDLRDSSLRDAEGHGLVLHHSAALLEGVSFQDNGVDLLQQDCEGEPVPVEPDWEALTCPAFDEPLLPFDFYNAVDLDRVQ